MKLRIRRSLVPSAASLALASCLAGCAPPAPPSLVLVTLDTTRPDRLGPYGHRGARTPHLDRFARRARVYERAYSTSSWTLPSHASLFTGLLPLQHGAQTAAGGPVERLGYPVRPLAASFRTLAEILAGAGYRTAAVVAGPALARELGLAQGFEHYDDALRGPGEALTGKRAESVADAAIRHVERFGDEPYFLFVNFFDPHAPYRPPAPWDRALPGADESAGSRDVMELLGSGTPPVPSAEIGGPARSALDAMLAGYDAEIAYMDHHLGRLLAAIEASPRADRTLVAITSDHGESFGEHYYLSHGAHLYEDNVRVPLLVRLPGGRGAGERDPTPVQNHRLFATLLSQAGLRPPEDVIASPLEAPATPLVTEVRRSEANVRLFGGHFDRDLRAIYEPPWKLIEASTGRVELYDLERDALELLDASRSRPELARTLGEKLHRVAVTRPPLFDPAVRAELDEETHRALRALGYLGGEPEP